ncbi:uncharacterized protein LOC131936587 [Physella acuta]|uniref:uncharacterized protein LOC131936587 n=1 Tax=Physella acuta TaxID=109671 RepID=UPI0027DDB68D|nr:uncharacterized protein LOC131936587 [Physella acuta]
MAKPDQKHAIKRLMHDQEELNRAPVANVSAAPLDENMFEWHCNIRQDDIIYHLILFFPPNYPYSSPSAEFVPVGFRYNSGATMPGKKGTKICLNIFSDFATFHTEWKNEKGLGWSPGYTIQSVLMNVVSFLGETRSGDSDTFNLTLSKNFNCADCGHSYSKPFPSLDSPGHVTSDVSTGKAGKASKKGKTKAKEIPVEAKEEEGSAQVIDYISKEKFQVQKPKSSEDLFGYGLVVSGNKWRPTLTSPCEFLTGRSFYGMKNAVNVVHSVLKEELKLFLPMYIHPLHGSQIKEEFEKAMKEVAAIMPKYDPKTSPIEDLVLKTIPNLMSATVVEFSKGTQHTSDNHLNGYFALHRLLLWAIDTYPALQDKIEEQIQDYVENENNRTKDKVPYIAEWLMLVPGSVKYKWQDVADAYLSESWKRNVMWYVKDDEKLGYLDTEKDYRIRETFRLTDVGRKHLAFQASFIDIAMPRGMTRQQIIQRYDDNLGFPSKEMVDAMKEAFSKINNEMENYQDWFKILKLPVPTDDQLFKTMVESVRYAIVTDGYHWTFAKTGGGWGKVLNKYKKMIEEHKEGKTRKTEDDTSADPEPPSTSAKGKNKRKNETPKGGRKGCKKTKVEEEADAMDDEEVAPVQPVKKAAPKTTRGRKKKGSDDNVPAAKTKSKRK